MPAGGLPFAVHGQLPALDSPVLVVQLTGWIDASGAAATAMETISRIADAKELITFDADTFIDLRARRPVMELRDGVNTRIVWSTPELRVGRDEKGKDVLFLSGPEPDSAWRFFARTVGDLAVELGVSQMIGLGAYPYGAPHTRPVGITNTTPRGVIHMVCGGGGAGLYSGGPEKNAEVFTKKYGTNNWVNFTAKFFDKKHSFAVVDLTAEGLELRALDIDGNEIDRATITKPLRAPPVVAKPED